MLLRFGGALPIAWCSKL